MSNIDKTTPMEELTIGGNTYEAGNAREFKEVKLCLKCI